MTDVKEAVKKAAEFFGSLFPEADLSALRLEEVELTEDEEYWLITLSFPTTGDIDVLGLQRRYKTFKVDAKTGRVTAMKVRVVE